MTFKKYMIAAFIAAILSIVIRSILRANGIHNFLNQNSTGQILLYLVILHCVIYSIRDGLINKNYINEFSRDCEALYLNYRVQELKKMEIDATIFLFGYKRVRLFK
ncbi:hypothetical protein [Bacillus salipaludis]|uniref:Uncharacterized protein n=1 Tax=Bacillus salipaludis TaxID=2547811 RepID=A0AA90QXZ6_9BACI|nr:hypothetical protein [Bacillus salipaludis]MDQ6598954.1 hypothetical protein [Bacillus salipaludis]